MKIRKVLVSQPKPTTEKSPYFDLAEKYNLKLEFRPFIKVEGVTAKEFRQERINILDHSAIIFTSRTAIDHFFRICGEMRVTVPDTMKYFCISEATAFYLQKYIVYRKRKIFYGDKKVDDMTKNPAETQKRKISSYPCLIFTRKIFRDCWTSYT